jgi:hypothetical protein
MALTLNYKSFDKGDARRYFVALLAVDRLKESATIHYVGQEIGCTRAEAQRALEAAAKQFGVIYERAGPVYAIASWGVLKKTEVARLVNAGK